MISVPLFARANSVRHVHDLDLEHRRAAMCSHLASLLSSPLILPLGMGGSAHPEELIFPYPCNKRFRAFRDPGGWEENATLVALPHNVWEQLNASRDAAIAAGEEWPPHNPACDNASAAARLLYAPK